MPRPSRGGTYGAVELRSRLSVASPPRIDVLVALAFVALGALESVFSETTLPQLRTPAIALPVLASLALRRVFPVAVEIALVAANVATNPSGSSRRCSRSWEAS